MSKSDAHRVAEVLMKDDAEKFPDIKEALKASKKLESGVPSLFEAKLKKADKYGVAPTKVRKPKKEKPEKDEKEKGLSQKLIKWASVGFKHYGAKKRGEAKNAATKFASKLRDDHKKVYKDIISHLKIGDDIPIWYKRLIPDYIKPDVKTGIINRLISNIENKIDEKSSLEKADDDIREMIKAMGSKKKDEPIAEKAAEIIEEAKEVVEKMEEKVDELEERLGEVEEKAKEDPPEVDKSPAKEAKEPKKKKEAPAAFKKYTDLVKKIRAENPDKYAGKDGLRMAQKEASEKWREMNPDSKHRKKSAKSKEGGKICDAFKELERRIIDTTTEIVLQKVDERFG